ncbi:fanconi-associated nuclease 1 homolog, partial [Selaginella moellendorffii]|uniref:fanconi-associated nuclease 1 homolog n=1 Tax=Selaginella moellendorffii TaxID=88036 RepID=UPI000D1CB3CC
QVIIGFLYKREILGGSNLTALIREATGPCIRIAETLEVLLWRLQRLFFLNGEQEFHVFLLVDIGRIKYPSYRCTRTMPVFASREDFLAYEQALQLAQVVDMSLEAGNSEAVNSSFRKARTTLELINAHTEIKHPFLARFSAAWVYATICTVAASFLEKERRYAEAVNLFKQVLSMQYCPGRRGYWTLRLSIDLEHLQRLEESLLVAENGLNDFNVRGGDRIALQRRVLRLGKPPRRWKVPPYGALLKKKHKVVTIMGRPPNNANGMKSRFYGYDGQQCSVEDLALQYYAGEDGGGWKGVHSESGIWLTLFGLFMWDVIFSDVPDVFQTPFQTAPLDLCTDSFYPVRSSLIESRLQAIRDGRARQLVAETWAEHYGTSCSGVNWEKYSLEDLQTITVCIGGPGLSAICKLLAEDHSNWTAGMPDLLLWKEKEAKLAEVKGPGDRLSEQQVAWFLILSDANVPVELCQVSKTMNDRS